MADLNKFTEYSKYTAGYRCVCDYVMTPQDIKQSDAVCPECGEHYPCLEDLAKSREIGRFIIIRAGGEQSNGRWVKKGCETNDKEEV